MDPQRLFMVPVEPMGLFVIESKRPEVGKLRLSYRGSLNIGDPGSDRL